MNYLSIIIVKIKNNSLDNFCGSGSSCYSESESRCGVTFKLCKTLPYEEFSVVEPHPSAVFRIRIQLNPDPAKNLNPDPRP